ncbi:histidine phosphatase family protein [Streptacidiphilus sp. PB12-B1b]|uniref:SixA phosphatase family protein n=1 Tax=Streptacidiphilus sp. PB12-B1b TaxID=2705012 RepID=UPI0015FE0521|nr:histidine phosphatase family protein [Streptacidiphilus sp. PB12-B1b]QMU78505.1 histidine phosphatase family protein [Streptacidiphilus sp. PB12-B1b]
MSVDTSRRIIVLRHAKADWPDVPDHERPLADRGRRDAPAVGHWLAGQGLVPDLALCSTAERTRETWKLVAHELPTRPRTVYEERLYEAVPGRLIEVLQEVPEEVGTVLLVGHNPAVQGLTEVLAGGHEDDTLPRLRATGFPTAAVAVLAVEVPWKALEPGAAHLTTFHAPGD